MIFQQKKALKRMNVNMNMYVSNERKGSLYIDLRKNDSVLMPKCEFKLAPNPNPTRCGAAATCARVVNQA